MRRYLEGYGLAAGLALPFLLAGAGAFGQPAPTTSVAQASVVLPVASLDSTLIIAGEVIPAGFRPGDPVIPPSARIPPSIELEAFDASGFRARARLALPVHGVRTYLARRLDELFAGTAGPFPVTFAVEVEISTGLGVLQSLRVAIMLSHPTLGMYGVPLPFTLNALAPRPRVSGAGE
jgi:hypothetical protein